MPRSDLSKAFTLLKRLFSLKIVKIITASTIIIAILPLIIFYFLRPKVQPDINYGITFSNKYASELHMDWQQSYLKMLDDLKVKNIRLIAYWDDIEKVKGIYDYTDITWQLNEAEKRNINVIMTIGYKVPRYPECFAPKWWLEDESEQSRNEALYKYISMSVSILKDYNSIKMWQVENEPFFPFGECLDIKKKTLDQEIATVRKLDARPILVQDSGEGGFWFPSYRAGDKLGISMYRKIWYNFWGAFLGNFIYFQYPLAHWSYKIKADLVHVPYQDIIVTELQAEPWGPGINSTLSEEEKNKSMSRTDFIDTLNYAQKAGFKDLYLWGAEWWLWEKEYNNNPYFWDTAKALFN